MINGRKTERFLIEYEVVKYHGIKIREFKNVNDFIKWLIKYNTLAKKNRTKMYNFKFINYIINKITCLIRRL